MLLTIIQIITLAALATFIISKDAVTERVAALVCAIGAAVWAILLLVGIL